MSVSLTSNNTYSHTIALGKQGLGKAPISITILREDDGEFYLRMDVEGDHCSRGKMESIINAGKLGLQEGDRPLIKFVTPGSGLDKNFLVSIELGENFKILPIEKLLCTLKDEKLISAREYSLGMGCLAPVGSKLHDNTNMGKELIKAMQKEGILNGAEATEVAEICVKPLILQIRPELAKLPENALNTLAVLGYQDLTRQNIAAVNQEIEKIAPALSSRGTRAAGSTERPSSIPLR